MTRLLTALRVSPAQVRALAKAYSEGKPGIPAVQIGTRWRFRPDVIEALERVQADHKPKPKEK